MFSAFGTCKLALSLQIKFTNEVSTQKRTRKKNETVRTVVFEKFCTFTEQIQLSENDQLKDLWMDPFHSIRREEADKRIYITLNYCFY